MPPEVREYTVNFLSNFERAMRARPRRKAGRQFVERERDEAIKCTVDLVAEEYKLNPTRNPSRSKATTESACSIVAKALNKLGVDIKERTVNDIYRRHSHQQSFTNK